MKKITYILVLILIAVSSCGQRYSSTPDPMDEFNEMTDLSTREEVREITGEFWCSEYGDYFAPDESDEIWCTFGGGLCAKYIIETDKILEDVTLEYGDLYVEVTLSGSAGTFLDGYYELDCDRTFYVTSLHSMTVRNRRL